MLIPVHGRRSYPWERVARDGNSSTVAISKTLRIRTSLLLLVIPILWKSLASYPVLVAVLMYMDG